MSEERSRRPFPRPLVLSQSILGVDCVEFIPHAVQRMQARAVSTEQVLATLRNPKSRGLPVNPPVFGRDHVSRPFPGRGTLHVIYDTHRDKIVVVTTFFSVT